MARIRRSASWFLVVLVAIAFVWSATACEEERKSSKSAEGGEAEPEEGESDPESEGGEASADEAGLDEGDDPTSAESMGGDGADSNPGDDAAGGDGTGDGMGDGADAPTSQCDAYAKAVAMLCADPHEQYAKQCPGWQRLSTEYMADPGANAAGCDAGLVVLREASVGTPLGDKAVLEVEPPPSNHVMPKSGAPTAGDADVARVERVLRQTTNYMLAEVSENGAPADQAAAEAAFHARTGLDWPKDPWGNPYVYGAPADGGKAFTLSSAGPDGESGTDDDIRVTE